MKDATRIVFDYSTNLKLNYDEELSLEDVISPDSNILIVSDCPYGSSVTGLSAYRSMVCCDISNLVKPYGSDSINDKLAKSRERTLLKERKRFSYVRGYLDAFAEKSFDWVIFDVDDARAELEKLGRSLDEIIKDALKISRNVAYIRYVDTAMDDDAKLAIEASSKHGLNLFEAYENVLRKGPTELQMDSHETGKIAASFRKAGFREVNLLLSPNVRRDPCINLSGGLFIYATDL